MVVFLFQYKILYLLLVVHSLNLFSNSYKVTKDTQLQQHYLISHHTYINYNSIYVVNSKLDFTESGQASKNYSTGWIITKNKKVTDDINTLLYCIGVTAFSKDSTTIFSNSLTKQILTSSL